MTWLEGSESHEMREVNDGCNYIKNLVVSQIKCFNQGNGMN